MFLRCIICVVVLFFLPIVAYAQTTTLPPARPNIILIVADDLSPTDVGAYGSIDAYTPNIDSLAASGIKFTHFYSQPACTPTRYELLTGNHVNRATDQRLARAISWREFDIGIEAEAVLLPELFRDNGYETALIGKWHLGFQNSHPLDHGFDYFYGSLFGGLDYNTKMVRGQYYDWHEDRKFSYDEGYITHLTTQRAVEYIERERVFPYFLYLAYHAPHFAVIDNEDPIARTQLPLNEEQKYLSQFGNLPEVELLRKRYLSMLMIMDNGIGQVLQAAHGTNTIIVFVGDNGSEEEYGGNTGEFREDKDSLYEGGIRVPGIINWRGVLSPGISTQVMRIQDIAPTLISLSNISTETQFDGLDLSDALTSGSLVERTIWMKNRIYGDVLIVDGWKYIDAGDGPELYNLTVDPSESWDQALINTDRLRWMIEEHAGVRRLYLPLVAKD